MEAKNETRKNPAGAQSRAGEAGANLSVGFGGISSENNTRFVFLSGDINPMPIGMSERRYMVKLTKKQIRAMQKTKQKLKRLITGVIRSPNVKLRGALQRVPLE